MLNSVEYSISSQILTNFIISVKIPKIANGKIHKHKKSAKKVELNAIIITCTISCVKKAILVLFIIEIFRINRDDKNIHQLFHLNDKHKIQAK